MNNTHLWSTSTVRSWPLYHALALNDLAMFTRDINARLAVTDLVSSFDRLWSRKRHDQRRKFEIITSERSIFIYLISTECNFEKFHECFHPRMKLLHRWNLNSPIFNINTKRKKNPWKEHQKKIFLEKSFEGKKIFK